MVYCPECTADILVPTPPGRPPTYRWGRFETSCMRFFEAISPFPVAVIELVGDAVASLVNGSGVQIPWR